MKITLKGFLLLLAVILLTLLLLTFIWAVAKIGLILTSFLAGVVVGLPCWLWSAAKCRKRFGNTTTAP